MPYVSPAEREVFVSRFNRVLAVLIWAAAAALTVGLLLGVHDARLLYIVPVALFAFGAWALLWRPRLTVADDGIEVVNVTRTVRIPWQALIHVDTKYALTLYTPGRKFPVWSAPATRSTAGRASSRRCAVMDWTRRPHGSPASSRSAATSTIPGWAGPRRRGNGWPIRSTRSITSAPR